MSKKDRQAGDGSLKTIEKEVLIQVQQDYNNSAKYRSKFDTAHNIRFGLHLDPDDVPFEGGYNITLPLADKIIRKRLPSYITSVWNNKQLASIKVKEFLATSSPDLLTIFNKKADYSEKYFNYYLHNKIDLLSAISEISNYMLEAGKGYLKVFTEDKVYFNTYVLDVMELLVGNDEIEDEDVAIEELRKRSKEELASLLYENVYYDIDIESKSDVDTIMSVVKQFKEGKNIIEFQIKKTEAIANVVAIHPKDIILPEVSSKDIDRLPRVTHAYQLNRSELHSKIDQGWDKPEIEKYLKGHKEDLIDLWEVHYKVLKSEIKDPSLNIPKEGDNYIILVSTHIKGKKNSLSTIVEPTYNGKYPIFPFYNEYTDADAHSSRGIPEMLRYLQMSTDAMINNQLNRDIVNNTPMFTIKRSSGIKEEDVDFNPGKGFLVDSHDDIRFWENKGSDVSGERLESKFKAYSEEYVGTIDFTFGNSSNANRGAKTLGEIQMASSEADKIASLDLLLFQRNVSVVLECLFYTLRNVFKDRVKIDDVMITKDMLQFPCIVVSNGNLEDSDKYFSESKAFNRLQTILGMPNEISDLQDKYNALTDFLEKSGVADTDRYATDPRETLQSDIGQLTQQVQQAANQLNLITAELDKKEKELGAVEKKIKTKVNKGGQPAQPKNPIQRNLGI